MLVRQNQPSAVETAAVIDQAVVHGGEHVYIETGEVELEQLHAALKMCIRDRYYRGGTTDRIFRNSCVQQDF